eukprot:COSAG02_NODE_579_length_20073_cov_2118.572745_18_plen_125_part_00
MSAGDELLVADCKAACQVLGLTGNSSKYPCFMCTQHTDTMYKLSHCRFTLQDKETAYESYKHSQPRATVDNPVRQCREAYRELHTWLYTEASDLSKTSAKIQLGDSGSNRLFQGIAWHNLAHNV